MRTWLNLVGWVGGILGVIALALYALVFDVWRVPSDDPMETASIAPTLSAGDIVLVTRQTSVARGNLLRCPDPQAPGRFVIARAIAVGGETFQLQSEVSLIDGKRLPSPRACDPAVVTVHNPQNDDDLALNCSVEDFGDHEFSVLRATDHPEPPISAPVTSGLWYLVSDDRHIHVDSRDFGELDVANCQHIVFRLASSAGFSDQKHRLSIIW